MRSTQSTAFSLYPNSELYPNDGELLEINNIGSLTTSPDEVLVEVDEWLNSDTSLELGEVQRPLDRRHNARDVRPLLMLHTILLTKGGPYSCI